MNNVNRNDRSTGFGLLRSLGWNLALITAAAFLCITGAHAETTGAAGAHQYQYPAQEIPSLAEEDPLVLQEMARILSAGRPRYEATAIQNAVFADQLEVLLEYGITPAEIEAALVLARQNLADNEVPVDDTPVIDVNPEDDTPVVDVNPEDDTPVVDVNPEDDTPVVDVNPDEPDTESRDKDDVPTDVFTVDDETVDPAVTEDGQVVPHDGAPARTTTQGVVDPGPADHPNLDSRRRAHALAQAARDRSLAMIAPSHSRTYVPPGMFTTREQDNYERRAFIDALAPLANVNGVVAMGPAQNEACTVDAAEVFTEAFNDLCPDEQAELQNLLLQQMETEATGGLCGQYRAPSFADLVDIAKKNVRKRRGSAGDTGASCDQAVDGTTEGEDGGYLGSDDETDEEDDDFGLDDDFLDSLDDFDDEMDAEGGTDEDSTPDATDDVPSDVSSAEDPDDVPVVTDGGSVDPDDLPVATDCGPVVTDDELRGYFEDKAQGHRDRATGYRNDAAGYRDRAAAARTRADAARDRANSAETEENRAFWEEQAESWDDAADIYESTADLFERSAASEDGFAEEFQNEADQVGSSDEPAASDAGGGHGTSAGVDDDGLCDASGSAPPAADDAVRGNRAPANWKAFPGSYIGSYEVDALYDWTQKWSMVYTSVLSVYYYLPDELSDAELAAIVKKCEGLPTDKETILCAGGELRKLFGNDNDRVCRHYAWAITEVLEEMGFDVDLWSGNDGLVGHAWVETTADGDTVVIDVFSGHYVVIE